MVVGGESPLQTESYVEFWDRRSNKWKKGPVTGIRLRDVNLHKSGWDILISGPSVCSSGAGAMRLSIKDESLRPIEDLKGVGVDGLHPLPNDEIVIWAKSCGEINLGIWRPKKKSITWTCSEINLPQRDDLARIYPCEDFHFLLLYAKEDGSCGARFVRPETGLVDEIQPIEGENRILNVNAITLSDGRVLVSDQLDTYLLST